MKKILAFMSMVFALNGPVPRAAWATPASEEHPIFKRPVVLVHGWGQLGVVGMERFAQMLHDDGVSRRSIHVLRYSYRKNLSNIRRELVTQFQALVQQLPQGQKFDVITHSTGQYVALDALLSSNLDGQVAKYIGLSGIAHGWDFKLAVIGALGAAERVLSPSYNQHIVDFYDRHQTRISRLEKCSLFSPDDGLIEPYDSGRFEDGLNIEVPSMRHMQSVTTRRFFEVMKANCYN